MLAVTELAPHVGLRSACQAFALNRGFVYRDRASSVARNGYLTAYRWSGERELSSENLVYAKQTGFVDHLRQYHNRRLQSIAPLRSLSLSSSR